MSSVIPSQNLRRELRWTQSRTRLHASVSHGGSSASGAQPNITTSTGLNTDVAREVRAGPAQDVTRTSSEDHVGGDVAMRIDGADEISGGHLGSAVPDTRRRITTRTEQSEVRDEQSSTTEQHIPRGVLGKTAPQGRTVAVPTQEALDGSREKTMRITSVENNALKWVSFLSAGALDMTHCDFSARSARDEMRHIIGSSEPDVNHWVRQGSEQGVQKEGQGSHMILV